MNKSVLAIYLFVFILVHTMFFTLTTLKIYSLEQRSLHLFYLLMIEAAVPLIFMNLIKNIITAKAFKYTCYIVLTSFALASLSLFKLENLTYNLLAGAFFTFSILIIKSKVTHIIPHLAKNPDELNTLNSRANLIVNLGSLFGFLCAGSIIKYSGYVSLNYAILAIITLTTFGLLFSNEISGIPTRSEINDMNIGDKSNGHKFSYLMPVWLLVISYWVIGGTINILEVPLATKYYKLDELKISFLFFFVSAGAIICSYLLGKYQVKHKVKVLASTIFSAALIVLSYGFSTNFMLAGVLLFGLGILSSIYYILTNELIQIHSKPEDLAKNSVLNQTITQTTMLLAGSLSSLLADYENERLSILFFCIVAMTICLASITLKRRIV